MVVSGRELRFFLLSCLIYMHLLQNHHLFVRGYILEVLYDRDHLLCIPSVLNTARAHEAVL